MKTTTCEVWILVDAAGDYVASHDADQLGELYESGVQSLADCGGFRRVKVTVVVPLPVTVELTGMAPEQGAAELAAVA